MKPKHIEVEGGEIAIRNKNGDIAIIPKYKKRWLQSQMRKGCHSCIDEFVKTLPSYKDLKDK
jgi:hypothetical protein